VPEEMIVPLDPVVSVPLDAGIAKSIEWYRALQTERTKAVKA